MFAMPRFYFDTHDGSTLVRDVEGHELADMNAARNLAMDVLPDMARDQKTDDNDRRDFIVDVRDDDHRVIYTACMSLLGRWML